MFQDINFPVADVFHSDMQAGVSPPSASLAVTPENKIRQAIQASSEGQYQARFLAQNRLVAKSRPLWEFYLKVGQVDSFRFRDPDDYYSKAIAQALGAGDGAVLDFQMVHSFGDYAHTITKPVNGTVSVYINNIVTIAGLSINYETGIITFDDITGTITAATNASPGQFTKAAHGLTTGNTILMTTFTGAWAVLNNNRYPVTRIDNSNFTIPVNTLSFGAYSGNGGQFNTLPQAGEIVSADFTHDYQVYFGRRLQLSRRIVIGAAENIDSIFLLEVDES